MVAGRSSSAMPARVRASAQGARYSEDSGAAVSWRITRGSEDEGGYGGVVVECVGVALQNPGSEDGPGLGLIREFREHGQRLCEQGSGQIR